MITPYPIRLKYDRIVQLAKEYDVELTHFNQNAWARDRDVFRKFTLDPGGRCDIDKNFKRCVYSSCHQM